MNYDITSVASVGGTYYALTNMGFLYSFRIGDSSWISVVDLLNRVNGIPRTQSSSPHSIFTDLLVRNGVFVANTWTTIYLTGGILISRDSGKTWSFSSLKNTGVYSIAGNEEYLFASTERGIYRSGDDGVTWDLLINNVFADTSVSGKTHLSSLSVRGRNLFVGSYQATTNRTINQDVYFSDDNGENWNSIGTGIAFLPDSYVNSISQSDSSVFVAAGKGLWKLSMKEVSTGIRPSGNRRNPAGMLSEQSGVWKSGNRMDFVVGRSGSAEKALYDGNGRHLRTASPPGR